MKSCSEGAAFLFCKRTSALLEGTDTTAFHWLASDDFDTPSLVFLMSSIHLAI